MMKTARTSNAVLTLTRLEENRIAAFVEREQVLAGGRQAVQHLRISAPLTTREVVQKTSASFSEYAFCLFWKKHAISSEPEHKRFHHYLFPESGLSKAIMLT